MVQRKYIYKLEIYFIYFVYIINVIYTIFF